MKTIYARYLDSTFKKLVGLTGRNSVTPVYFETRFGIHTFGMKKNIDVIVLDENFRVVKLGKNINPGKLFFWSPAFYRVLEIPANSVKIKIGEKIKLILTSKAEYSYPSNIV